jgi:hypothetical protein
MPTLPESAPTVQPDPLPHAGGERTLSAAELQSYPWYATTEVRTPGAAPVIAKIAIGLGVAALVAFVLHRPLFGGIIAAVALLIGVASLASDAARRSIDRAFARLGEWIGLAVSWILLGPIFLVGFTIIRGWMWVTGADPLQLSRSDTPTYWLAADSPARKRRFAGTMFGSERVSGQRGVGLGALAVLAVAAVLIAELVLRLYGFGHPILYRPDPQAMYYPAPNQQVGRYGGRIAINRFGMRGPDYAAAKAPGTFRLLMIGDSTLYGGSYVDQPKLYSRLLEDRLRRAAGGRPVEVMAIGVNAWGPFHELGYLKRFGTFDADLVMVNLPILDIYRPQYGLSEVPFFRFDQPPRLALEEMFGHLTWRFRAAMVGPQTPEQEAWNGARGLAAYAELAQLAGGGGKRPVLFEVLPSATAGVDGRPAESETRDVQRLRAAVPGSPVSYPTGMFRTLGGQAYHDSAHLNASGHAAYAPYLEQRITATPAWRAWAGTGAIR